MNADQFDAYALVVKKFNDNLVWHLCFLRKYVLDLNRYCQLLLLKPSDGFFNATASCIKFLMSEQPNCPYKMGTIEAGTLGQRC